jgi:hypothetical protein
MLLKDNVTYFFLCFVLFAKWRFAATIHPATTVLEHIVAMKTRKSMKNFTASIA